MKTDRQRLIIGISGASGAPLAVALLRRLHSAYRDAFETHVVATRGAELTLRSECGISLKEMAPYADVLYDNDAIGAAIASGSFRTAGMIIVPCSMKTVAGIVSGYSDNLLLRAADVTLKERRKLVLVARESPLGTVHLRNLYEASQLGAVILPPMLTYYRDMKTLDEHTEYTVDRVLMQFGVGGTEEWQGL